MQATDDALETLPMYDLARRLREETIRFLHKDPLYDERPGLTLFRIAFTQKGTDRANAAWEALYTQYEPLVQSWITQQSSFIQQSSAVLVNTVFAKFFQALSKGNKIEQFRSLAAMLRYLKLCTNSVVSDARRAQQNQTEDPLDAIQHEPAIHDPTETIIEQFALDAFWQKIQALVDNDIEYLLLVLTYQQEMKPQEILVRYPHLFSSLEDIYRLKRNVIQRLRRRSHLFAGHAA